MDWHMVWNDTKDQLDLLDQRFLPTREDWYACTDTDSTIFALQVMVIRGAPAIGVTAAYGCYLAAKEAAPAGDNWKQKLDELLIKLEDARPTAVNLRWGVRRMRAAWDEQLELDNAGLRAMWLELAKEIHEEDKRFCRKLGEIGGTVINDGDTVMTHCNAGALATSDYGTALGVIRGAWDAGKKKINVIANETRPFLQGARLTSWELMKDGIPVKVACDNACALLMKKGLVDKVVVGADRIAANGDAANKIGTMGVAILAKHFGVPFYVAAPLSTIDRETPTGDDIPIEDRTPREVTHVGETQIVPDGVEVYNLAFDPTPNELIAGIITEEGILEPPYAESIPAAFARSGK
ncbi:S-methyl-5-thioribose-1-phosphate isomerase [Desulfovibrio ferrophilus]|uniref:Methylthioribose-1-phosphate isomerase n=1 Tax=Desulfovibrio ferrophilus TaxID=241368 RepID=A0A2Z6AXB9_9BACT|nr:S-methyl-5-thioribose-1-phosphate isomerase [Desulfovibrio ferrophilus]BBD07897.1 translation initiation factor, aIF-2BI family [Desulfovibrio ferrophilus]